MNIKKLSGTIGLGLLILSLAQVQAATYYVSTTGNDANSGTSNAPLRTITHAYSLATPGTTILVEPGTYTDYQSGWGLHLNKSGTASSPITLKSLVPLQAIIDGQFASDRNKGFIIDGSYNVVHGFTITRAPNTGVFITGNSNQILDNNIFNNGTQGTTDPEGQGIFSNEGSSGNIYERNYIHDNGFPGSHLDHGLYLCGNNEVVANNVVLRQPACGLQIAGYTTVNNMKVFNNVFAWNGTDGIIVWQALNGVDIRNNILYHNGHYGIGSCAATGGGLMIDHNLAYANGYGTYNLTLLNSTVAYTMGASISADPLFVNETSSYFDGHLTGASPAIGTGINYYTVFTNDIAGLKRQATGNWEMGAHVYATTNVVTAAPAVVPCTLAQIGGQWTVTWNSTSGKSYWVGYKNSLSDPSWTDLSGTITASGSSSTTSYTDTTGNHSSRFYCVWVTN